MPTLFDTVEPITYKGPDTDDPLAFRFYDAMRVIAGKTMAEHLRFAVCYWHSFCWPGSDVFGQGTLSRPWLDKADALEAAEGKLEAAIAFTSRLGAPFLTFHDRDLVAEGATWRESVALLDRMADRLGAEMERAGLKLLWGTANLFSHPRYAAGAATNPDPDVFACAAAQVAQALEVTHRLAGANYVLWGGREGYDTLLNTDLKREARQFARFLAMVAEHKAKIGFKGPLLIEPKPHEPTKHQYDRDCATVHAFLASHGLEKEFKLNIEANHATLAGNAFPHELAYAAAHDLLGSVDANRGDPQNGWDTDQFPNDPLEAVLAMAIILQAGGLAPGGFNFDAKVRRQSTDVEDLFLGHIGGMDTLARGLIGAAQLLEAGGLQAFIEARYAGWREPLGASILEGGASLEALRDAVVAQNLQPRPRSGGQERLENYLNRFV